MSTTTNFSNLHDEIKTEIFSRVPAKSVLRFRCLSKSWNARLSTSYFINLHLFHNTHRESLLLLTKSNSLQIIDPPIENPTNSKTIELENTWTELMGSCNGLVLLMNLKKDLFLVNPITFEQFKVPKLTFGSNVIHTVPLMHGFGYDSYSDDYKILVVSGVFFINNVFSTSVNLYSVRSGVWKSIDHSLYNFVNSQCPRGVFMNGSIHWYDSHQKEMNILYKILAFNLTTEVFHEVDIPLNVSGAFKVFAHEGRLCALNPSWTFEGGLNWKIDLWMMNEYGVASSWTKLGGIVGNRHTYLQRPLYFSRDGDCLLVMTERTMVVFNIHEGTEKDVDGVLASSRDGCSFVGSLVSLKGRAFSS